MKLLEKLQQQFRKENPIFTNRVYSDKPKNTAKVQINHRYQPVDFTNDAHMVNENLRPALFVQPVRTSSGSLLKEAKSEYKRNKNKYNSEKLREDFISIIMGTNDLRFNLSAINLLK